MLNISAFYLSQKRLNEVLPPETLAAGARHFSISDRANAGITRTAVISAYEKSALQWLSESKFPLYVN